MGSWPKEGSEHTSLNVRMKVGFWLLNGEETMPSDVLGDFEFNFKKLQGEIDQVRRTETRLRNASRSILDEQPERSKKAVGVGRGK
jgi:hypothetical protein